MIVLSTQTVLWLLLGAASIAAFMVGKHWNARNDDLIIENTIMFLVDNGLVRWKRDENGEIELLPIDEK
jgi:hypothetical protein